jgi:hypothetical protein
LCGASLNRLCSTNKHCIWLFLWLHRVLQIQNQFWVGKVGSTPDYYTSVCRSILDSPSFLA